MTLRDVTAAAARKRSRNPVLLFFFWAVLQGAVAPAARGQLDEFSASADSIGALGDTTGIDTTGALGDTTGVGTDAAAADTLGAVIQPPWSTTPKFVLKATGDANRTTLDQTFTNKLALPHGMSLNTSLQYRETDEIIRNEESVNKSLRATLYFPEYQSWRVATTFNDNRRDQSVVSTTRTTGRFVNNDRSVEVNAVRSPTPLFENLTLQSQIFAQYNQGQHDFKFDRRETGSVHGVLKYVFGGFVGIWARGYVRDINETSEVRSREFGGQGSNADSVGVNFKLGSGLNRYLHVYSERFNLTREFVDLPRNLNNSSIFDLDAAEEEREATLVVNRGAHLKMVLTPRLTVELEAERKERDQDFRIQTRRNQNTIDEDLTATIDYLYQGNNRLIVDLIRSQRDQEYGPTSTSDNILKDYKVKASLTHKLSDRSTLSVRGETGIQQYFYKKRDANPQDRDLARNRVDATLSSTLFGKIRVNASGSWYKTETVWIDSGRAGDNNDQTQYNLRLGYSLPLNERLTIDQTYGLAFDFFDYVYAPEDNFLDRTTTFSNVLKYQFSDRLSTRFQYEYLFKDKGSYLTVVEGQDRLYYPDRREYQDVLTIELNYRLTRRVRFAHRYYFRSRSSRSLTNNFGSLNEEGGSYSKLQGHYPLGKDKKIQFTIEKVDRWGELLSPQQKDYWHFTANLELPL
jgi:uncharacterized protein (DUF1684 family)